MDKLAELSHGAKVVLGATIAFLVVSIFNWQEISLGEFGDAGVSMWHGIGVIAGLLAIVIVVWQAIRLANINVEIGVTPSMITAALALLLVIFTVIKFLVDGEFRTFWAWIGLALAIVVGGRCLGEHEGRGRGPRRRARQGVVDDGGQRCRGRGSGGCTSGSGTSGSGTSGSGSFLTGTSGATGLRARSVRRRRAAQRVGNERRGVRHDSPICGGVRLKPHPASRLRSASGRVPGPS